MNCFVVDNQGKFNKIFDEPKDDLNELKTKLCKLESDLHISRNANNKLSDKLVIFHKTRMSQNIAKFLLKWGIRTLKKSAGDFVCNRHPC